MTQNKELTLHSPSSLDFREHRIPRGTGSLYAREYPGLGPTFVLMHGFPDNLHIYDLLIPALVAKGRHVVTFDFLGFGASDKPAGATYSFEQQLGDLVAVVDFLGLDTIIPVGHDAGGISAIDYALAHPERVSRLCLQNTFYAAVPTLRIPELIGLFAIPEMKLLAEAMAADPAQMAFLLAFQQGVFKQHASQDQIDTINLLVEPIIHNNFFQEHSALPAFTQMASMAFTQVGKNTKRISELEQLVVPCTIVWGLGDTYLNVDVAEDLASHIRGTKLHVIDAGHWPQLDSPREVALLLLNEAESTR